MHVCVLVCVCVRACVHACVRACVCVCSVYIYVHFNHRAECTAHTTLELGRRLKEKEKSNNNRELKGEAKEVVDSHQQGGCLHSVQPCNCHRPNITVLVDWAVKRRFTYLPLS